MPSTSNTRRIAFNFVCVCVCAFTWLQLVHHAVGAQIALSRRKSIFSAHREANRQVPYQV